MDPSAKRTVRKGAERKGAQVPTLFENVDLIAGTSTGGLISLMLASRKNEFQPKLNES